MRHDKYSSSSDEQIIRMILTDGKKELFRVLYDRYQRRILDKCFSLLKSKELAEDARQIIFEKTYEKLATFKGKASFSSWIYSITYNYCIDYLRNKKRLNYPEWNQKQELPEIIDEIPDEENLINYDNLTKILDMVHPEEKALLLMKYSDDLSINDIARSLRLTESATKMRLKRARARILYLYKQTFRNE